MFQVEELRCGYTTEKEKTGAAEEGRSSSHRFTTEFPGMSFTVFMGIGDLCQLECD